jgi:hydroxyacylglutathione hydrolase
VAGLELGRGTHIENHGVTRFQTGFEFASGDGLQAGAIAEIRIGEFVDADHMFDCDVAQGCPHVTDTVTRQHVDDPGSFAASAQHTCPGHGPEMVRGVRHALSDLIRELLDGSFALRQDIDNLCTTPTRQRLGDLGERIEQSVLRYPVTHLELPLSSYSNYYLNMRVARDMFNQSFELTEGGWVHRVYDFVDEGLGHSSYVIDLGDGTAAIVDPPRFPTAHDALVDRLNLRLAWTLDTHSHADYVTGSPALAERTGATFVAPAASHLESPHRSVSDNEHVTLAERVELVALATPGHTPDHHAYVLVENGAPVALFSGGSLMVGTVGRTDLCGPELAIPLAHEMFGALRRLDQLPDDLPVYPTHGAGSFCSAPGDSQRTSTLGHERMANPLFALNDEDMFVERLVAGFGTFPTYFSRLPELNRLGPIRYDSVPRLAGLHPDDVERHLAEGGIVADARRVAPFSAGHVPGSLSNTLRPVFASWLGWLVEPNRPIAFVLDPDQDRADLVRQCLDVGHENLVGELAGGIDAWTHYGRPLSTIPLVDPIGVTGQVIDVRQANEYTAGHVPGSINIELGAVRDAQLTAGPVTVMCGHGERAMTAASILKARGKGDVVVLDGGPDSWSDATGNPLETSR